MRTRDFACAALAVALLTGCGGGTEPTPGTADPAGLWDVSLTDMSEPIGGYATACETGFTMSVNPADATDVYQVLVPYNVTLHCAGGRTLPWIFAASFLIIHRSGDSLYFLRPQGDTLVKAALSATTMFGPFTAPFRPVARFSATRHKGSTDPNLAPISILAGIFEDGTLDAGDSIRADARLENAYGQPVTAAVRWTSSDPTIATISDAGMIHGLRPGSVSITATADTLSSSAPLLVLAPPASVELTQVPDSLIAPTTAMLRGVARDAGGQVLPERRFHWTSSDPAVATVDEYGIETVVTPHAPGTVTITARSTLSSATATIRILAAVGSVELSGSDGRIPLGTSVQLSVVLRDQAGRALAGRPVSWESGSESIVSVTGSGRVTALRATPIPIVASAEGVADTLIVSGLMDGPLTDVAAGAGHTCGLTQAGTVYCWGHAGNGRLGGTAETGLPVRTTTPVTFASLAAGSLHTCGLTPAGAAWCWGADEAGQLGQAGVPPGDVVEVSGGKSFVRLGLGGSESCGLTAAAEIWCWGANGAGQLGRGTSDQNVNASPGLVTGGHQFADVGVGGGFACGITTADELWCWGANDFGQLGLGTVDDQAHASPVRSLPGVTVRAVALGGVRACAALTDGTVQCWGDRLAPTPVPGVSGIVSLTAGTEHFCGLDATGSMECWGEVALYNLAYAPSVPVAGMTAGGLHTCARPAAGRVVCWGLNDGVQLGAATDGYGPVEVAGQP